jgi:membrane-bound serine protease (ClpP class)
MFKRAGMLMVLLLGGLAGQTTEPAAAAAPARKTVVYVIPVKGEINSPTLYILRRGLKEAIEQKADAVLLDMNTPGGALDVTFEIMEALEKFPGQKLTFVDREAMSAGSLHLGCDRRDLFCAQRGHRGGGTRVGHRR